MCSFDTDYNRLYIEYSLLGTREGRTHRAFELLNSPCSMGAWSASLRAVVGAMVLSVGRADMLYAVGGEAGSQGATNSMERFNLDDPDARWELSIAMPSE
eukprot:COSAG02_NODE_31943_length_524_cov_10.117647_1_plen_99_part_10